MSDHRPGRAALWMVGAIIAFSSMAVAGRAISLDHDTFEILLFRSILGVFIVVGVASVAGTLGQISRQNLGMHLVRNLCHFTGQNLWFYAVPLIPLAQLFALEFTSPIWVALLAPLVLGERLTRTILLAISLGFAGVLIVARPDPAALEWGTMAAAASALGFAGAALFTRKLTRTESVTSILFWLTVMQMVFGIICAGYDGQINWPTLASLPWLTVIALAGLGAHFCITQALRIAPAAAVMPMDFARLPVIALVGFLFYNESLDFWLVLGAAMILGANWINIRQAARAKPA